MDKLSSSGVDEVLTTWHGKRKPAARKSRGVYDERLLSRRGRARHTRAVKRLNRNTGARSRRDICGIPNSGGFKKKKHDRHPETAQYRRVKSFITHIYIYIYETTKKKKTPVDKSFFPPLPRARNVIFPPCLVGIFVVIVFRSLVRRRWRKTRLYAPAVIPPCSSSYTHAKRHTRKNKKKKQKNDDKAGPGDIRPRTPESEICVPRRRTKWFSTFSDGFHRRQAYGKLGLYRISDDGTTLTFFRNVRETSIRLLGMNNVQKTIADTE